MELKTKVEGIIAGWMDGKRCTYARVRCEILSDCTQAVESALKSMGLRLTCLTDPDRYLLVSSGKDLYDRGKFLTVIELTDGLSRLFLSGRIRRAREPQRNSPPGVRPCVPREEKRRIPRTPRCHRTEENLGHQTQTPLPAELSDRLRREPFDFKHGEHRGLLGPGYPYAPPGPSHFYHP